MASVKELGKGKYRVCMCATKPDGSLARPSKVITAKSTADAKKQSQAMEVDFRRSLSEPPPTIGEVLEAVEVESTLNNVLDKWRKIQAPTMAVKTYERYEGMLDSFIIPRFGSKKISEIKSLHIQEYLAELGEDGIRRDGKPGGYSQKTIKSHFALLRVVFACAERWDMLQINPFRKLKAPKVDKHEADYLDTVEIKQVLDALIKNRDELEASFDVSRKYKEIDTIEADKRKWLRRCRQYMYETYVWLALTTGGRRSEITGLWWSDIDFEKAVITIRRTHHYTKSEGVYDVPKLKNGAPSKDIPIAQNMVKKLEQYKLHQDYIRQLYGNQMEANDCLFISLKMSVASDSKETQSPRNTMGNPINPDDISQWFSGFLKKNGLPMVTLHQLRHSNISFLVNNGVPVEVVASIAGHNPEVTRQIYEHIYPNAKREGVEKFNTILEGRM